MIIWAGTTARPTRPAPPSPVAEKNPTRIFGPFMISPDRPGDRVARCSSASGNIVGLVKGIAIGGGPTVGTRVPVTSDPMAVILTVR